MRRVATTLCWWAALLLSGAAAACTRPTSGTQRMVYFAPAGTAEQALQPFPIGDWQARGVAVVYRFSDLQRSVGATTQVIVLDAATRPYVDIQWLRTQLHQHRVVVGINIDMRDLQELLGDTPPLTDHWHPADPMFSLKAEGQTCSSGFQDRFTWWAPLDRFLEAIVRPAAECAAR